MVLTVSFLAYSFVIRIILFFLLHVTLIPVVIDLTSGFDKCFESIRGAAVSK